MLSSLICDRWLMLMALRCRELHARNDGWLMLGLEMLSISYCMNH